MTIRSATTNVGIAAAMDAATDGIALHITNFKLGSGVNYTPSLSDTDLRGTVVYDEAITQAIRVSATRRDYIIILPSNVGNFQFGEIGLYLSTGELINITTLSELFSKVATSGPTVGNVFQLRIPIDFSQTNTVTVLTQDITVARLGEVATFNQLPAASTTDTNSYLIKDTPSTDKCIAFASTGQDLWSFSNYKPQYTSLPIVAIGSGYVEIGNQSLLSIASLGDVIFQVSSGAAKGLVRLVTAYTNGTASNIRLNYANALTGVNVGDTIQVWYNFRRWTESIISATVGSYIPLSQRGTADGVATLDTNGRVPNSQINSASETAVGIIQIATSAEVTAATNNTKAVTPVKLSAFVAAGYIPLTQRANASGVATLDSNSKIPIGQIPDAAITTVFKNVADQASMLALSASSGDIALRTDQNKTYMCTGSPASNINNWVAFLTPPDIVQSVNGLTGSVVITTSTIGAVPTSRSLTGAGLLRVGNTTGDAAVGTAIDLTSSRLLYVAPASTSEVSAASSNSVAVTPLSLAPTLTTLGNKAEKALSVDVGANTRNVFSWTTAFDGTGASKTLAEVALALYANFATSDDVKAGTANNKLVTPAALSSVMQKSANGYYLLPGGVLLQWGQHRTSTNSSGTVYYVPYNVTFNGNAWAVAELRFDPYSGGYNQKTNAVKWSDDNAGFSYRFLNNDSGDAGSRFYGFDWIAIGAAN